MELVTVFGGVVVSLLVEFLKNKFGTDRKTTIAIVVGLSFVGSVGYMLLLKFGLWESFLSLLTTAGAFYTFIIESVESNESK